jgi:hypothetical protein
MKGVVGDTDKEAVKRRIGETEKGRDNKEVKARRSSKLIAQGNQK